MIALPCAFLSKTFLSLTSETATNWQLKIIYESKNEVPLLCQFCLLSFWHLTLPIISNPIRICEKHLGQEDKLKSPVLWEELDWNVCFALSTCLSCAHIWIVSLRAVILPSSHSSDRVYHCKTCLFSFLCTLSSAAFYLWCLS